MASPRVGSVNDRGVLGIEHVDKRLTFRGSSWLETDSISLLEDFLGIGATLADNPNVLISQSGTATAAAAVSASAGPVPVGHGGWVAGSVDNVDGEIDEVALGKKPWANPSRCVNGMLVAEAGFVIPTALTARQYFFGLGDAETGGADDDGMIAINTGTTLISGATGDAAGFVLSSLATDANGFYMGAVKATAVGTAVLTTPTDLATAVVDQYTKLRVEVDADGDVYFFGVSTPVTANRRAKVEYLGSQAAAVTANILYCPIFSAASTTTTAVEWEIDYLFGAIEA